MKTIIDTWNHFGRKEIIKDPKEILHFFEYLIKDTNGLINIDFIDGGFSDGLVKIVHNSPLFYFYWKDFSNEFFKSNKGIELTEEEVLNLTCFSNNTLMYQMIVIKDIVILELTEGHPIVAINSIYINEKEIKQELTKNFGVNKNAVESIKVDFSSYQEFIFTDQDGRNHSCQYIQLPNYNLLIQDKVKPYSENYSQIILNVLNKNIFKNKTEQWVEELKTYQDYYDENNLVKMCFEIRLYTEKLLKFLLVNLIKVLPDREEDLKYNLTSIKKSYNNLLNKYGHNMLSDLKKAFNSGEVEIDFKQSYINKLNEFSHETGNIPLVNDVNELICEFSRLFLESFQILEES
ncbi:hypothetical protein [Carnobacterium maltaromaticum]|uniref:hypothetical protein n=1 Tax=Carnobacterium maltaromaticum TaxID=2751 RepID=UPI00295E8F4F|nr:hypothetical protein [Carnobacterium maltaromaticum]